MRERHGSDRDPRFPPLFRGDESERASEPEANAVSKPEQRATRAPVQRPPTDASARPGRARGRVRHRPRSSRASRRVAPLSGRSTLDLNRRGAPATARLVVLAGWSASQIGPEDARMLAPARRWRRMAGVNFNCSSVRGCPVAGIRLSTRPSRPRRLRPIRFKPTRRPNTQSLPNAIARDRRAPRPPAWRIRRPSR